MTIGHDNHSYDYDLEFNEHDHNHAETAGLDVSSGDYADAHEPAHAEDIKRRFANQNMITLHPQSLFGLTNQRKTWAFPMDVAHGAQHGAVPERAFGSRSPQALRRRGAVPRAGHRMALVERFRVPAMRRRQTLPF